MKITCVKCEKEQRFNEYFSRFLPKGSKRPIYVCEKCENELGGKAATLAWVIDVVVKDTTGKPIDLIFAAPRHIFVTGRRWVGLKMNFTMSIFMAILIS